jgi:Domain of unknown function (DUF4190)/Protein of unknown function (DUF2950)
VSDQPDTAPEGSTPETPAGPKVPAPAPASTPAPVPVRPHFQERYERPTSPTVVLSARPPSKILAITSLLLAILGVVCAPLGVLALLLGISALGKISRGTAAGKGLAIAGTVLGAVGLLVSIPLTCTVVIPSLTSSGAHPNELKAIGMLRTYSRAQSLYRRGAFDGGPPTYASRFPDLHSQSDATGRQLNLIDASFANAEGPSGVPRHGYLYADLDTVGGKPINWVKDFGLCARPAKYEQQGRKTFIMRSKGAIWAKDQGPGGGFVTDFPSDPGREGWERVQ